MTTHQGSGQNTWKLSVPKMRPTRLRILARNEHGDERELDYCEDISQFEQDFLVAFHDVCSEFIVAVLQKQKVLSIEQALNSGKIDLEALSVYLELLGSKIIKDYGKVFPHTRGVDLTRVSIHTVYDRNIKDIVIKISFFRE